MESASFDKKLAANWKSLEKGRVVKADDAHFFE